MNRLVLFGTFRLTVQCNFDNVVSEMMTFPRQQYVALLSVTQQSFFP